MPLYRLITNASIGNPDDDPQAAKDSWKLYSRLEDDKPDSSLLLMRQIAAMQEPADRKAALAAVVKLIQVAATGKPLTDFYDKKQCHGFHQFLHPEKPPQTNHSVYRIWKGARVRLSFYYGADRSILLVNAFSKKEDKLTNAQTTALETEVKIYLNAMAQGTFRICK